MKNILLLTLVMLFSISMCARKKEKKKMKKENVITNAEISSFAPNKKLLNQEIWTRVSENRFECNYLRLAVELRNFAYILKEMDGKEHILAIEFNYYYIRNKILELTLRKQGLMRPIS
jgi:hypothetical protein